MKKEKICFILNSEPVETNADPAKSLLCLLREDFGLTGTKEGCGRGECGACTVLLNDLAVNSCLIPAGSVAGMTVTTIEALSGGGGLSPIQEAFVQEGAVQCGYCTPGMIMSAHALLRKTPDPDVEEIRAAISGNLCRCTGYKQIEEAILLAARNIRVKL